MPLRVYCPDCHAPRTAPEAGARVECRRCGRVFRAGTRVGRREPRDDPRRADESDGSQKLMFVLVGVALVVVGLVLGCGLAGWYFLVHLPPDDGEVIEADEPEGPPAKAGPQWDPGPPPVPPVDPGP